MDQEKGEPVTEQKKATFPQIDKATTVSIALVLPLCLGLIAFHSWLGGQFNELKSAQQKQADELKNALVKIDRRVEKLEGRSGQSVTTAELQVWALRLERANRKAGLKVPEVE